MNLFNIDLTTRIKIEKTLWPFFICNTIIALINATGQILGLELDKNPLFLAVLLSSPALLMALHGVVVLGFKKSLLFATIAFSVGIIVEILGTKYGVIFGGNYTYPQVGFLLYAIPFSVPVYWAVFIYTSYSVTNSFLTWLAITKPSVKNNKLLLLLLLVVIDGLITVAIDLFMDPVLVGLGKWQWVNGGAYFNIPVGNFVGWFFVTVLVTGIFRLYEYISETNNLTQQKSILLIPILGYFLLWSQLTAAAIQLELFPIIAIGSLVMLPTIFFNLYCYFRID